MTEEIINGIAAVKEGTKDRQAISTVDMATSYWGKCCNIIRDNINESAYSTWFKRIKAIAFADNELIVSMPSQFFCEWIETHYYSLLRKTIAEVCGQDVRLKYAVEVVQTPVNSEVIQLPAFRHAPVPGPVDSVNASVAANRTFSGRIPVNTNLNPAYNFDNLVVGESNRTAIAAAHAIADNPGGTRFNMLFIYGKTGIGKTHIASAAGNAIAERYPNKSILYTSSENFSIEYVNAIKQNKISEFKELYQSIDVLIIDDIQFLATRAKTQNSFFHIFNSLHQQKKQLIIVADRPPKEIDQFDDRLISRFQWGLTVGIGEPDLEMRKSILKSKSEAEGVELSEDVLDMIARNVTSSVRELEGFLITLFARRTFENREIDLAFTEEIIKGIAKIEDRPVTADVIIDIVSEFYNISIETMKSNSRKHIIALARQMAIYLIKEFTKMPLKSIGQEFGGRDHTTIIHSCRAIDDYLMFDKNVKKSYEKIKSLILNR